MGDEEFMTTTLQKSHLANINAVDGCQVWFEIVVAMFGGLTFLLRYSD